MKLFRKFLCALGFHDMIIESHSRDHCHKKCSREGCTKRQYADYGRNKFMNW